MKVVYKPLTPKEWPEVHAAIHCIPMPDTRGVVAFGEDGGILACGVADTFSFTGCQVHLWINNPLVIRHGFLNEIFHYIFVTCDRLVIVGMVPGNNSKALRFNRHLGYTEVARIPDGFNFGVDYVIMQMKREECRFIRLEEAA